MWTALEWKLPPDPAMGRSAPQRLAIDAAAEAQRPHPSLLSTAELRAEHDTLAELFASA